MEIGYVTAEELPVCASLFLPQAAEWIAEGDPVVALAVTEGDLAIGAVAGYLDEGVFSVESLYVSSAYRRRGAGRLMVETLRDLLKEDGFGMIIHFTVTQEEHKTLFPFLEAMGFFDDTDSDNNIYLFTLQDMTDSPFFAKASGRGRSFAETDEALLRRADRDAVSDYRPRPQSGLIGSDVEAACSVVSVKDQKVVGYAAVDHSVMGYLTLAGAWTAESENPSLLPSLLRAMYVRLREKYPPDTPLAVQTVSGSSAALIHRLIPNAAPISYTYFLL